MLGPTTYRNLQMNEIKISIFHDVHARRRVLQLNGENEREGLLPGCRVGVKERERTRFQLIALAARTVVSPTDDRVTRQATSDRQPDVRWFQVRACTAHT